MGQFHICPPIFIFPILAYGKDTLTIRLKILIVRNQSIAGCPVQFSLGLPFKGNQRTSQNISQTWLSHIIIIMYYNISQTWLSHIIIMYYNFTFSLQQLNISVGCF